ncbi:oogenesin-1-like [Meriones unguiculatus]|uniref:oogenesin-1-like n=1 Tax=Meriones unguiculatus TaxID=10047 RepID=UPI000B4FB39D|nr:oogenesin-1-like [Meriones unguiculatus]
MAGRAPPTQLQLAIQALLHEEDLAISSLAQLPMELFPVMFEDALTQRRTKVLKAMVPAWPFPYLPVGALLEEPDLEILKALLDGVDVLITQGVCGRRPKLKVLDLRKVYHSFWSKWAGSKEGESLPQVRAQKQTVESCPGLGEKIQFKVVTNFMLSEASFSEYTQYLLQWARGRKDYICLCCRELGSHKLPIPTVIELFKTVDLDCVLDLELCLWWIDCVVYLYPYLGQMRNLHTFRLNSCRGLFSLDVSAEKEKELTNMLLYQLSKLHSLRHLRLYGAYFLEDNLAELFRHLRNPLNSLSITYSKISQSDFNYLTLGLNVSELKHLFLSGVVLTDICPEFLGILLERVSSILETLDLEECKMRDSHFNAMLPALSQCFQLEKILLEDNDISLLVLKNLLHHTGKLKKLSLEYYPAPLECYEGLRILTEKFLQFCPELLGIIWAQREPKKIYINTKTCLTCFVCCSYGSITTLCLCK